MGVDYYIQFPCKVREQVSNEELLRMEKARNRALYVLDIMRNDGRKREQPESEWTMTVAVLRADGPQETEVKIYDLLAEAEPLKALAAPCQGCPANLQKRDFGCGGAIRYPITPQAEAWLVERLPEDLKTGAGKILCEAIKDYNFNGRDIDAARVRKELYASTAPAKRTWGGWLSKTTITSSQILEMSIGIGSVKAPHAKMIALFLGYVDMQMKPVVSTANNVQAGDAEGVADFKHFLNAMAFAGCNELALMIDA